MTNEALRPDRRSVRQSRRRGLRTPFFVVLEVCLLSLNGIAINLATTNPSERVRLPGPLRPIADDPLAAVAILTVVACWLAVRQWQRGRSDAEPSGGGPLVIARGWQRPAALTPAEHARVRQELLGRVRRTWISGVLERSLAHVARVELGLAERPDAVAHPWGTLLHQPGQPSEALPPGTTVAAIAGRFDAHLLILGAPGAGKTTLLLEYARDLLDQAERDPQAPIPVVLHLSAWPAEPPPLAGWLASELGLRYGVPRQAAAELVDGDRLAVLLDGLDEVPAEHRVACARAINAFHAAHGRVPLVVCARTRQYEELKRHLRLGLGGAVEVQPLDRAQVRDWLQAAGRPLAGLRGALRDTRHWLWGLLDSPLWLSISVLTYSGQPARAIRADGSQDELLAAYVERMLARGSLAAQEEQAGYARTEVVGWLAWLARRMGAESVFYPDWMQLDWLPTRRQRWLINIALALAAGLAVASAFGLGIGLASDLVSGLGFGLVAGVVTGLGIGLSGHRLRIEPVEQLQWSWKRSLAAGLTAALGIGLGVGLATEPAVGLAAGLATGLALGLIVGLSPKPNLRPTAPFEGVQIAARKALRSGLITGVVVGLAFGLGIGLAFGRAFGLATGLASGLGFGLTFGPTFGLFVGLANGGISYLQHRVLCVLLRRGKLIPDDLVGFLDYADSRVLLRRAGGGYLFVHRLLQDYFARQDTQATNRPGASRRTEEAL